MKALVASVALALAVSAPAEPKAPCPIHETGTGRPWATSQVMDGDLWAHVFLHIDKHGRAVTCTYGNHNIFDGDLRAYLCESFRNSWTTPPQLVDGQPVEADITRYVVIAGRKHRNLEEGARQRYLREHPDARRECLPDY